MHPDNQYFCLTPGKIAELKPTKEVIYYVLHNLLNNAIKFSHSEAEIRIESNKVDGLV
jgi:signal transduction histidine kinase